jgi:hypothetical protein
MATPAGKPYISEGGLTLQSRPYWKRVAVIPMALILLVSWTATTLLAYYAAVGLVLSPLYANVAVPVALLALIMAGCLILYTRHLIIEGRKKYTLVITDAIVRLMVSEKNYHIQATMPIDEIEFVEYFTARDRSELIFHGKDNRIIEAPLWSMTDDPSTVVEFLRNKGIAIAQL